jgi:hypothetical protein
MRSFSVVLAVVFVSLASSALSAEEGGMQDEEQCSFYFASGPGIPIEISVYLATYPGYAVRSCRFQEGPEFFYEGASSIWQGDLGVCHYETQNLVRRGEVLLNADQVNEEAHTLSYVAAGFDVCPPQFAEAYSTMSDPVSDGVVKAIFALWEEMISGPEAFDAALAQIDASGLHLVEATELKSALFSDTNRNLRLGAISAPSGRPFRPETNGPNFIAPYVYTFQIPRAPYTDIFSVDFVDGALRLRGYTWLITCSAICSE